MTSSASAADTQRSTASPALAAKGITKAFPGVVANDRVDFTLARGEVHALLGENGAGKSTLASILSGLYRPDDGEIRIAGRPVHLRSPRDALEHGVGMVHQHFRLVRRFSVAQNVALGDRGKAAFLRRSQIEREVGTLAEVFGLELDASAIVAELSIGEQQRVEIIRMLYRGVHVLLLDEPTSGLTPQEAQALFGTVRSMAAAGRAVVLITHKLREVAEVSDRVTVMRDGRVVGTTETARTDERDLARMMIGRNLQRATVGEAPPATRREVLRLENLSGGRSGGKGSLDEVSLRVDAGEIVGVAGVAGNGQRALAEVVAGLRAPQSGKVMILDRETSGGGPGLARAAGLAYVPEDRLGTGLAPDLPIADNLLLTRPRSLFLNRRRAAAEARRLIREFSVKATGPWAPVAELSGGNIQKVLLARELSGGPSVLVIASPTRGLDVASVEFVRKMLLSHRAAGSGILMISEDLDEILTLSDRILVIYEGRIVHEVDAPSADVMRIGLAMAGGAG